MTDGRQELGGKVLDASVGFIDTVEVSRQICEWEQGKQLLLSIAQSPLQSVMGNSSLEN